MPELHLNDRSLRNLKTSKAQEDFKDSTFTVGEFGVRLSANGSKRFFVRYRISGKRRRMMLGAYPGLSLADARKRAHKLCVETGDGADPAKVKSEKKKAETVQALYEAFMEQKKSSFAVTTYRNYWAMWGKDCKKLIGDMRASEVDRQSIIELLDNIEERTSAPHMVNRTRTMLMSLFNWAVSKNRCKFNPVIGVPKAQQRELPGERFLSRDEIRIYWQAAEEVSPREGAYWKLLLLLALRPGELAKLRWDWIDGEVLTIPGSSLKNKREHKLFLSDLALESLEILKGIKSSEYLFASPVYTSHQKNFKEAHSVISVLMGIPSWTPRDIRRTCETQMRTFIRDGEGISRVLNHDVSQIRKHYDRGDYFERKKEVLLKWTAWLENIVREDGSNVIDLASHRSKAVS